MRPSLLKRVHSHSNGSRGALSNFLHSRENSPHPQADTISGHKLIEEETLPRYNADAFYPARQGETLHDRYKLLVKLGYGMTATVWLAKDIHANSEAGNRKYVTIKINVNTLTEDFLKGRREIAQKLCTANPQHPGYHHVRFMLDTFKVKSRHGDHLCIVYDVLREPIDLCMDKFTGRRFNSDKLRILLPALLTGLDYLHSECRVVHTDLKADNIMMGLGDPKLLDRFVQHELEHPSPRKMPDSHGRIIYTSSTDFGEAPNETVIASAKITDIGLAAWGDQENTKPIQSNAFMAPEVILQCGWSYPADIWNLGVVLWDLCENFGLFDAIETRPGHYRPEKHLGLMIALLGPPPPELLARGAKTHHYFDATGAFKHPEYVSREITLESTVARLRGEEKELFLDFARKMVAWLPEDRWTAKQLLDHPYLTKERESATSTPGSLSRASTGSFCSLNLSRSGTPGPPPTSIVHGLCGAAKPVDRVPPRSSPPLAGSASLEKVTSSPLPGGATTLPIRPEDPDGDHSTNASNRVSQDLIDSILNKKKPRTSQLDQIDET